jgi:mono/diheme cytochrome c family protein
VVRGEYLVNNVFACIDCHTPRNPDGSFDLSKHLSGVECFIDVAPSTPDNGVGCLHSRNLTPHATGLGTRTDQQIKDAFLNGSRPGGGFLANVMPYWLLHNMTAEDADAIVAYLRSVPAVDHMVPASQMPWNDIPAAAPPVPDGTFPAAGGAGDVLASAQRGRYIAKIICVDCHTPDAAQGATYPIDLTKPFWGNRAFPVGPPFPAIVYSANLTPHATGLAGWTVEQVVTALKQGRDNEGAGICPPMPAGPMGPFGELTDGDATDLANYLLNLEPQENTISGECVLPGP